MKTTDEEIDCPLFMDKLPEDPSTNPGLSAISSLIYDHSTPEERAENFKEEANRLFRLKKKEYYQDAIKYYTRAIDEHLSDPLKNSVYYSNRAAVNLLLGNFGKVISDCDVAISLDPSNIKSYFRASTASLGLDKLEAALDYCDRALLIGNNPEIQKQRDKVLDKIDKMQKIKQKEQEAKEKKRNEEESIFQNLKLRNIVMGEPLFDMMNQYTPYTSEKTNRFVTADQRGMLHWSVLFLYEEHHQSDFIQDFCELDTIGDHLRVMFPASQKRLDNLSAGSQNEVAFAQWDLEKKYVCDSIEIYIQTNSVRPLPPFRELYKSKSSGSAYCLCHYHR